MANLLLVDSNFFIHFGVLGLDPLKQLALYADDWDIATCGVVMVEVVRGRSNPFVKARFVHAFGQMAFLEANREVWDRAAELAWTLDREGRAVALPDVAIAATALVHDATLMTMDGHFSRIPGLRILPYERFA